MNESNISSFIGKQVKLLCMSTIYMMDGDSFALIDAGGYFYFDNEVTISNILPADPEFGYPFKIVEDGGQNTFYSAWIDDGKDTPF